MKPWEKYGGTEAEEAGPWDSYRQKPAAVDKTAIAKDMQRMADPTAGTGFAQQFTEGMGKAMTDLGRGAAQMVNLGPSAAETRETKRLDAPLMKTTGGVSGNIAGNVAMLAPLAVVPGANTVAGAGTLGALTGALQPTENVGERLANMGVGGGTGSGVQTVARYPLETAEVVKSVASAPFKAAKALVEPFYQGGRDQILSRALQGAIGRQNVPQVQQRLQSAQQLIPGSQPTAAEVGQSGGLAAMQRAAAAVDPESYATRAIQQNEARVAALQDMAGTQGQRDFFAADRSAVAKQMYQTAYDLGVDLSKLSPARKGEVTKLLRTPAIQQAVKDARTLAANEMVNMRNPAGSVQGLDYVKRALDDQINNATGNEQRILAGLKDRLLTTIDTLSPDYAMARQTFQTMSRPINQMDVAQEIANRSIRPLDNTLQPSAFARNLSDDVAQRATGFSGATLENTMEPQQLATLNALKDDLARSVLARDLGRGPGSDTTQKLAMTNLAQRAGLPQGVINLPALGRFGNWVYDTADERMKAQLAQALLNPHETASLLSTVRQLPPQATTPPALGEKTSAIARALLLPSLASQLEAQK